MTFERYNGIDQIASLIVLGALSSIHPTNIIDIVHRTHAIKLGLQFERAESLNTSSMFIKALADVVRRVK